METSTEQPQTVITVISDSTFVLPVFVLVLSLKSFQPAQRIHILGISLTMQEKQLFTQFDNVFVFESSIARSDRPGAMRIIADILKGEALLTAAECEEPWIALLDGDCIATGDISEYLAPAEPALYARARSEAEDNRIFTYYRKDNESGGIPADFLQQWQNDVGQRTEPARNTTCLSGNLILHRQFLDFAEVWKQFMEKVLNPEKPGKNPAYYMPAEFCLSAWLMFADNPPPVRDVQLNSNPQAYLAHLGPAPKYWHFWTRRNIRHFDAVTSLLDEAKAKGYEIPLLPFALKKRNKTAVVVIAIVYDILYCLRRKARELRRLLAGNAPKKRAQKYVNQRF